MRPCDRAPLGKTTAHPKFVIFACIPLELVNVKRERLGLPSFVAPKSSSVMLMRSIFTARFLMPPPGFHSRDAPIISDMPTLATGNPS